MGVGSSKSCVSIVLGVALVSSGGCVRLDEEHCIVNGGDFACEEGRKCAMEYTAVTESSDRGDGCVSDRGTAGYFGEYFVHVKYGLPEALGENSGVEEDLDSLVCLHARWTRARAGARAKARAWMGARSMMHCWSSSRAGTKWQRCAGSWSVLLACGWMRRSWSGLRSRRSKSSMRGSTGGWKRARCRPGVGELCWVSLERTAVLVGLVRAS
jgi:hypothetical protein